LCLKFDAYAFASEADPVSASHDRIGDNNVTVGLKRLAKLSQERGFDVLIAIWPEFSADRFVDRPMLPDSDTLVVEGVARSVGVPTVRLSTFFRKHWQSQKHPQTVLHTYTVGDAMHPNAHGCHVAALAIKDALDRLPTLTAQTASRPADPLAIEAAGKQGAVLYDRKAYVLDVARALNSQRRYRQAAQVLENFLSRHPDSAPAHRTLADAMVGLGNTRQAASHYRRAVYLQADFFAAHVNLANLLSDTGRADQAVWHYRKAISLRPESVEVHFNLGNAHVRLGQYQQASECYLRVLRLDPSHARARANLRALSALKPGKSTR